MSHISFCSASYPPGPATHSRNCTPNMLANTLGPARATVMISQFLASDPFRVLSLCYLPFGVVVMLC